MDKGEKEGCPGPTWGSGDEIHHTSVAANQCHYQSIQNSSVHSPLRTSGLGVHHRSRRWVVDSTIRREESRVNSLLDDNHCNLRTTTHTRIHLPQITTVLHSLSTTSVQVEN